MIRKIKHLEKDQNVPSNVKDISNNGGNNFEKFVQSLLRVAYAKRLSGWLTAG